MRGCGPVGPGIGLNLAGTRTDQGASYLSLSRLGPRPLARGEHVSTPTGGNALGTDFDLMRSVAAAIDTRNEEIRATLQSFIGRMSGVPASVWGGMAASRFRDVVHRWNAESMKLHHALQSIAEAIRHNEVALRDAADNHALHIGTAAGNL
jgi:WXG100 family type VII secretion target